MRDLDPSTVLVIGVVVAIVAGYAAVAVSEWKANSNPEVKAIQVCSDKGGTPVLDLGKYKECKFR